MEQITIRFPDQKMAEIFWGWYLDGGGEQEFMESLEDNEIDPGEINSDWDKRIISHKRAK